MRIWISVAISLLYVAPVLASERVHYIARLENTKWTSDVRVEHNVRVIAGNGIGLKIGNDIVYTPKNGEWLVVAERRDPWVKVQTLDAEYSGWLNGDDIAMLCRPSLFTHQVFDFEGNACFEIGSLVLPVEAPEVVNIKKQRTDGADIWQRGVVYPGEHKDQHYVHQLTYWTKIDAKLMAVRDKFKEWSSDITEASNHPLMFNAMLGAAEAEYKEKLQGADCTTLRRFYGYTVVDGRVAPYLELDLKVELPEGQAFSYVRCHLIGGLIYEQELGSRSALEPDFRNRKFGEFAVESLSGDGVQFSKPRGW